MKGAMTTTEEIKLRLVISLMGMHPGVPLDPLWGGWGLLLKQLTNQLLRAISIRPLAMIFMNDTNCIINADKNKYIQVINRWT